MGKTSFIYVLMNPDNNDIRYVGKSITVHKRLYRHINDPVDNPKTRWIKELKEKNIKPVAIKIDEINEDEWEFWEKYWIDQIKSWGFNLTNLNAGGVMSKHSKDAKNRMSEIKKKTPTSYWLGKKRDPEMVKRSADKIRGRKQSEETKLKRLKSRYPEKYN